MPGRELLETLETCQECKGSKLFLNESRVIPFRTWHSYLLLRLFKNWSTRFEVMEPENSENMYYQTSKNKTDFTRIFLNQLNVRDVVRQPPYNNTGYFQTVVIFWNTCVQWVRGVRYTLFSTKQSKGLKSGSREEHSDSLSFNNAIVSNVEEHHLVKNVSSSMLLVKA